MPDLLLSGASSSVPGEDACSSASASASLHSAAAARGSHASEHAKELTERPHSAAGMANAEGWGPAAETEAATAAAAAACTMTFSKEVLVPAVGHGAEEREQANEEQSRKELQQQAGSHAGQAKAVWPERGAHCSRQSQCGPCEGLEAGLSEENGRECSSQAPNSPGVTGFQGGGGQSPRGAGWQANGRESPPHWGSRRSLPDVQGHDSLQGTWACPGSPAEAAAARRAAALSALPPWGIWASSHSAEVSHVEANSSSHVEGQTSPARASADDVSTRVLPGQVTRGAPASSSSASSSSSAWPILALGSGATAALPGTSMAHRGHAGTPGVAAGCAEEDQQPRCSVLIRAPMGFLFVGTESSRRRGGRSRETDGERERGSAPQRCSSLAAATAYATAEHAQDGARPHSAPLASSAASAEGQSTTTTPAAAAAEVQSTTTAAVAEVGAARGGEGQGGLGSPPLAHDVGENGEPRCPGTVASGDSCGGGASPSRSAPVPLTEGPATSAADSAQRAGGTVAPTGGASEDGCPLTWSEGSGRLPLPLPLGLSRGCLSPGAFQESSRGSLSPASDVLCPRCCSAPESDSPFVFAAASEVDDEEGEHSLAPGKRSKRVTGVHIVLPPPPPLVPPSLEDLRGIAPLFDPRQIASFKRKKGAFICLLLFGALLYAISFVAGILQSQYDGTTMSAGLDILSQAMISSSNIWVALANLVLYLSMDLIGLVGALLEYSPVLSLYISVEVVITAVSMLESFRPLVFYRFVVIAFAYELRYCSITLMEAERHLRSRLLGVPLPPPNMNTWLAKLHFFPGSAADMREHAAFLYEHPFGAFRGWNRRRSSRQVAADAPSSPTARV